MNDEKDPVSRASEVVMPMPGIAPVMVTVLDTVLKASDPTPDKALPVAVPVTLNVPLSLGAPLIVTVAMGIPLPLALPPDNRVNVPPVPADPVPKSMVVARVGIAIINSASKAMNVPVLFIIEPFLSTKLIFLSTKAHPCPTFALATAEVVGLV
jgi:hypothetical protein